MDQHSKQKKNLLLFCSKKSFKAVFASASEVPLGSVRLLFCPVKWHDKNLTDHIIVNGDVKDLAPALFSDICICDGYNNAIALLKAKALAFFFSFFFKALTWYCSD